MSCLPEGCQACSGDEEDTNNTPRSIVANWKAHGEFASTPRQCRGMTGACTAFQSEAEMNMALHSCCSTPTYLLLLVP